MLFYEAANQEKGVYTYLLKKIKIKNAALKHSFVDD